MITAVRRLRLIMAAVALAVGVPAWLATRPGPQPSYAAMFANASELVANNDIRLNDVKIGRITGVRLDGLDARVTFTVADDIRLPNATRAVIRQTSLLGEYHVALEPAGEGRLAPGSTIPLSRTRRTAEVESLVALGGDLASRVNVDNLNRLLASFDTAFGDDPARLGRFIDSSAAAAAALAGQRDAIAATIDQVERMAARLAPHTADFGRSLERFAAAAAALDRHRDDLGALVTGLGDAADRLGTLLAENERRLVQAVPEIRQVLGEVVGNLGEVERTVQALPAFNRGWACATDGHYLNFVFPITPEVARVDDGAGRCNPEAGPRGRDQQGQVKVAGPGLSDRDDGLAELLGATTRPGEGR